MHWCQYTRHLNTIAFIIFKFDFFNTIKIFLNIYGIIIIFFNDTVLMRATVFNNPNIVSLLLSQKNIEINKRNIWMQNFDKIQFKVLFIQFKF